MRTTSTSGCCLAEHMTKFKMSIQLNFSTFYKHFSQTNENAKKKSITNWYQQKFQSKNVISFTVQSLAAWKIFKTPLPWFWLRKKKYRPASIKTYKVPRSKISSLKALLSSTVAASEYSLRLSLSILNILNVCYNSEKTKLRFWEQSTVRARELVLCDDVRPAS